MKIKWTDKEYIIDSAPGFLVSGEFHYFRVPRHDWERRLTLLKEAGMNCAATYIPWEIHEPREGEILFGDIPERDLEGFLKLCAKMGILVICRPGPYQYTEMRYDGLPEWLCENYPEIHAADVHGKTFRKASVSYLHPVFLEKTHKWFNAVCPILGKYMVSMGGPVAFIQIDNEMMGIHFWYSGGWDYNRKAMGIGEDSGRYTEFLRNRYPSIHKLNQAYKTDFADFVRVLPFAGTEPQEIFERRRVKDYQDFYFETIAEYALLLTQWMREYGIDCGIVHNSPNPASNPQFLEVVRRMGEGFLLGSDHYYSLGPGWEQNNPTPQYAAKVFLSNEMLRLMGFPPTVFELPGGSASDWPPVTPEDLRGCYYINLAFGMKGLNYFIFTGGPNPFKCGRLSDLYDYGAAVGSDGAIRPVYQMQKEFGSFLQQNAWLASSVMCSDIMIGLDWEMGRCSSYFKTRGQLGISGVAAWDFLREGLLTSALCSSYVPELADLERLEDIPAAKPLLIAASASMSEKLQKGIVGFIQRGGKALLCPVIPYMDENFKPCTVLADFLRVSEIRPCGQYAPRLKVGDIENVFVNGTLFECIERPPHAVCIAREEFSGAEAGWKLIMQGGGSVIWLGLDWVYSMGEHRAMFHFLMNELGGDEPVVKTDNPNIWTVLRRFNEKAMLFVMNPYSAPMAVNPSVRNDRGEYMHMGDFNLNPMEVRTLEIDLS